MKGISDNVSYLRGLAEGMQLASASKEGLVIVKMLDVLDQMAQTFADMQDAHNELSDYLETVDSQLTELQNSVNGEEMDDDDFDEDELDDEDMDDEDEDMEEDDFSDDNVYFECVCPACKSVFYVDANELGDDVKHICPACGEHVHVEAIEEENLPIAELAPEDDDPRNDE